MFGFAAFGEAAYSDLPEFDFDDNIFGPPNAFMMMGIGG
jgi:hypothetical protein